MKEKQLTGYLIDAKEQKHGPITIVPTLENLYKLLNCDLITMTYRTITGK